MIKVLIVDDIPETRDHLSRLLGLEREIDVAGTAQDAEVIKFAQSDVSEVVSLTAIVRHADDEAIEETLGITIDQLVEEFGLRIPNIVEQLNEEAAP